MGAQRDWMEDVRESKVGRALASARKAKEMSAQDVCEALKIRIEHVQAIEAELWMELPGTTYAYGFVRNYARLVGLDPESLVDELKETNALQQGGLRACLQEVPKEEGPSSGLLWIVAGLFVVGVGFWWIYLNQDRKDMEVVQVMAPETTPSNIEEVLSTEESGVTATQGAEEHSSEGSVMASDSNQDVVTEEENVVTTTSEDLIKDIIIEEQVSEPEASIVPAEQGIKLVALGNVWFQIRNPKTGRVYVTQTLTEGQSYEVTQTDPESVLDVGASKELQIEIGGENYGAVGTHGFVVKHLPLQADYLINDYYANNLNTQRYKPSI